MPRGLKSSKTLQTAIGLGCAFSFVLSANAPAQNAAKPAGAQQTKPVKDEKAIFKRVQKIVSDLLKKRPELVTMNSNFMDDLGADSLDTVELTMAFEEEFNIEIKDDDAAKLKTVGDAVRYISTAPKSKPKKKKAE